MFATASPHETVPVHGASRGLERYGFRRERIVRKRMVRERWNMRKRFRMQPKGPAQDSSPALRDRESCDDRPRRRKRRGRASGSGVKDAGWEAIPSMHPATPGPAEERRCSLLRFCKVAGLQTWPAAQHQFAPARDELR